MGQQVHCEARTHWSGNTCSAAVREASHEHSYLLHLVWQILRRPHWDFSVQFPCECISHENIDEKWKIAEDARLGSSNAGSPAAAAAILPNYAIAFPPMPANALVQRQTPLGGSAVAPVLQQQSPLGGAGLLTRVQPLTLRGLVPVTASMNPHTPSGATPKNPTELLPWTPQDAACPRTPPKSIMPRVPVQPGSPAKAQRHCPEWQSPLLVGRAHIGHSTEPNCKRLKMSICDQQSELSQCGVGLQCDDGRQSLSEGEQQLFLDALSRALQLIQVDFETVTIQVMIREEKWADLKAIQGSVDVVSACLAQKHAGVPGCWLRSTAMQTIDRICKDFAKQPLMKHIIAHLQEWGGRRANDSVYQVLQEFSASWDLQWDRQKADFVNNEQWERLHLLSEMRKRLLVTLSSDVKVSSPDQHRALQELLNLKAISSLECFQA